MVRCSTACVVRTIEALSWLRSSWTSVSRASAAPTSRRRSASSFTTTALISESLLTISLLADFRSAAISLINMQLPAILLADPSSSDACCVSACSTVTAQAASLSR